MNQHNTELCQINLLTFNFNKAGANGNIRSEKERLTTSQFDLQVQRIHSFVFDSENIFQNEKTKNICAIIGYISNLNDIKSRYSISKKNDVEIIEELYRCIDLELIHELDGVFTLFIWNGNEQKGYIFQDRFASNLPLYYIGTENQLVMSTSLKQILKLVQVERKLDVSAVLDFLATGFTVPNETTFIEGVKKLTLSRYLEINANNGTIKNRTYMLQMEKVSRKYAEENLMCSLDKQISSLYNQLAHKELACTLSGGFDSNLILHHLAKLSENVTAITIAGKKRDEIPQAREIAQDYTNVKHIYSRVEANKLQLLPDIIWKTEGYLCEDGLFLQLQLAEMLTNVGKHCFLGECADQVLNQYRLSFHPLLMARELLRYLKRRIMIKECPISFKETNFIKYLRKPSLKIEYDILLDTILKKSGIMLNNYGIQGIYPFLNKHTYAISKQLGSLNDKKEFYKKRVGEILGERKMSIIRDEGGSTDIEYLFQGQDEIITKLMDSQLIKKILGRERMLRIKNTLELGYEFVLRLLTIFLFNRLFVSGDFDSKLDEQNLDVTLDAFFED